ncbi:MAG: amino acid ABC transporter permease [Actinomycetota bacterium]|nr:amino acid ABC transporter permease [Actinomycetota bacterium]
MDESVVVETESRPEEITSTPREWIRNNLFSNIPNTILTIIFGAFTIYAIKGLLGFILSGERRWEAVATNMRLLMAQGYPAEQFVRVWFTLGCLMALTGLSLAVWGAKGRLASKKIAIWIMNTGVGLGLFAVLAPISGSSRLGWIIAAVIFLASGMGLWFALKGSGKLPTSAVSSVWFSFGFLGILVLSLWVVPFGHYAFVKGELVAETGRTVAMSTKLPFSIMWLILIATYLIGTQIREFIAASRIKPLLMGLWLLSPFVLNWIVLRDPDFDYGHVASTDIPIALFFILVGGAILFALSKPALGEIGRITAIALLVFAVFNWVAAFFGWYSMLQKVRISFVLLALAALIAQNFASDKKTRFRFVAAWTTLIVISHWLITAVNSPSTLKLQGPTYLGGFSLTLFVAILTLLLSFPLGVLLALGRTSSMPIARVLCTGYIESIRGVPLITILFFFSNILPLFLPQGMEIAELAAIVTGYTLFSAAYLAENVRGGLQSVMRGQYEAADAIGLTTSQRTGFIVLPQALRVSIPPLVGQAIGVFKETSLVAIIGAYDILRIANSVVPAQTEFLGVKREGLLLVSVVYFIVAFSMSKYSRRLEERVGLGER